MPSRGFDASKYVPLPGDPIPEPEAAGKRPAPRDRERSRRYTPEELEAFRIRRREEAERYMAHPPTVETGFFLEVEVLSATIVDGEIRAMIRFHGGVQRPEAFAEPRGIAFEVVIPATVTQTATPVASEGAS
jgi:hypothetical protein